MLRLRLVAQSDTSFHGPLKRKRRQVARRPFEAQMTTTPSIVILVIRMVMIVWESFRRGRDIEAHGHYLLGLYKSRRQARTARLAEGALVFQILENSRTQCGRARGGRRPTRAGWAGGRRIFDEIFFPARATVQGSHSLSGGSGSSCSARHHQCCA